MAKYSFNFSTSNIFSCNASIFHPHEKQTSTDKTKGKDNTSAMTMIDKTQDTLGKLVEKQDTLGKSVQKQKTRGKTDEQKRKKLKTMRKVESGEKMMIDSADDKLGKVRL